MMSAVTAAPILSIPPERILAIILGPLVDDLQEVQPRFGWSLEGHARGPA